MSFEFYNPSTPLGYTEEVEYRAGVTESINTINSEISTITADITALEQVTGSVDLSALTTVDKTGVINAINENVTNIATNTANISTNTTNISTNTTNIGTNTTNLANLKKSTVTNYINVAEQDDYNKADISVTLNRLASTIQAGDVVMLVDDTVHTLSTITMTMPTNAKLIIDAEVIVDGDYNGFNITGNFVNFNVYIKSIKNVDYTNYATKTSSAIQFTNGYNGQVTIEQIQGFREALYLKARGAKGIQYTRFNFLHFQKCVKGIVFDCLESPSIENWINENTFTGGKLACDTAITSVATTNAAKNIYNNNKFYNIGFEGVATKCIDVVQFYYAIFRGCRMLETLPSGVWVTEGADCYFNYYESQHPIKFSKFQLGYCSRLTGILQDDSANIVSTSAIYKYEESSGGNVICFNGDINGLHYTDTNFSSGGGTVNLTNSSKYVECMLAATNRTLAIQSHLEFPGYHLILSIGHTTGSGTLAVSVPTGGVKWTLGNGVYQICYNGSAWYMVQLSANALTAY